MNTHSSTTQPSAQDASAEEIADVLVLDEHTQKDLELFQTDSDALSLFEFCRKTRTDGGARVLRRRMASPWCRAESIQATQDSVSFIMSHRELFSTMPSAYVANRVDHYSHEVLPNVIQEQWLEFRIGAFSLWANHDRHYSSIALGVQVTCIFIDALREFAHQPEFETLPGELAPLIEEMSVLLARPRMSQVPRKLVGGWIWKVVRLDQVFRLHEKSTIARLQELIHEVDAIVSMADVTSEHGYILPTIKPGGLSVEAQGLVHPFVADPVSNPVQLNQDARLLFLTGPNMAGKTTYLRSFATALYFAHLGMGVAAQRFDFVPAQRLFSSISLSDDLRGGISYFRAEALRVKAIAQAVAQGYRVVALMDEPFKGTNVKDALDASRVMLDKFSQRQDCLFMFSSHLIELSDELEEDGQIDCRYFEAEEGEGKLRFDYQLRHGISNQRLGMRVLQEEGVFDLLEF